MDNNKLIFFDLSQSQSYTVPANSISFTYTNTQKKLMLNRSVSEVLREGNYPYLRVGTTGFSNEVYFVFCKKQTPDSVAVNLDDKRICINVRFIVNKLNEILGLNSRSQHLHISENVSNSPEYVTYKITKQ